MPSLEFEGSSPRMRGAPDATDHEDKQYGIIPAYAGSTQSFRPFVVMGRDHPRVCGEHSDMERFVSTETGSSPRMRGALGERDRFERRGRIIPAYAGSTSHGWVGGVFEEDHPRVCGEHAITWTRAGCPTGSSPRMRGAPLGVRGMPYLRGTIPAYAGSTTFLRLTAGYAKDHPRVCGEHWIPFAGDNMQKGSSPRMRGARC